MHSNPQNEQSHDITSSGDPRLAANTPVSFPLHFLENSHEMVAAIDRHLHFIAINDPFRREFELVLGRKIEVSDRIDDVLLDFPADREKAISLCRRALAGETFKVTEDFGDDRLLRKYYEIALTPILDTRRQPLYAAIVMRDLTMERLTEKRFGPLLEVTPDATLIVRKDGRIELANTQLEALFGYDRHQLHGVPIENLIPERFRSRHIAQRNRFALQPATRPMGAGKTTLLGLRADGTEFPVEISLHPLDTGAEMMFVASIRDMTVRQRTEDDLRAQSQELELRVAERTRELERTTQAYRATFEQSAVGIAHVGLQGQWLRVNGTLADIVGYSKEEMSSLTFQDITHPDDLEGSIQGMHDMLSGELQSFTCDKRYLHKNGAIVWVSLNASLVRDRDAIPEYFIAIIKDISDRKRAEEDLSKSKESLELAIEATGLGMVHYDLKTEHITFNDEMRHHMALSAENQVTRHNFLECVHPHDRPRVRSMVEDILKMGSNTILHCEFRVVGVTDCDERWIAASGRVYFDEVGHTTSFIGTTLDITASKQIEDALRQSEQQMRQVFDTNPIGTVRGTADGLITDANAAFLKIIGHSRHDLENGVIQWDALTPHEHLPKDHEAMRQARKNGVSEQYEKEYVRPDGTRVPVLLACAVLADPSDFVAFALDITERKGSEERIRQTSLHDTLTGLPNRSLLYEHAKHVFGRARRAGNHCAVMFFDLDRFKPINDTYGHEAGDAVLREVAQRIQYCTRKEDLLFRLGGDEFLIIMPEVADTTSAGDAARHVARSLSQPYRVRGLELSVTASIGISIYPQDGDDIDTLINNADAAMYLAKQAGRNNIHFYSQELAAWTQMQLRIEEQLKVALSQNAFEVLYQPLVDMKTLAVIGVEALVRWRHESIGPDQFVPVAESTGQINRISEWVITQACRQHKTWLAHGLPAIPIAVNISGVQLRNKHFAQLFTGLLKAENVKASAIQVEVTETALMENLDQAIDVLRELGQQGIKVALDDFGTGYSSLNYLSRLPINKVKVDKSFVQRIDMDAPSRAITEAVIALGRSLNLEVVAEGIESRETLDYLRRQGCSQGQGYLVSKPVSAERFEGWYRHYQ